MANLDCALKMKFTNEVLTVCRLSAVMRDTIRTCANVKKSIFIEKCIPEGKTRDRLLIDDF